MATFQGKELKEGEEIIVQIRPSLDAETDDTPDLDASNESIVSVAPAGPLPEANTSEELEEKVEEIKSEPDQSEIETQQHISQDEIEEYENEIEEESDPINNYQPEPVPESLPEEPQIHQAQDEIQQAVLPSEQYINPQPQPIPETYPDYSYNPDLATPSEIQEKQEEAQLMNEISGYSGAKQKGKFVSGCLLALFGAFVILLIVSIILIVAIL